MPASQTRSFYARVQNDITFCTPRKPGQLSTPRKPGQLSNRPKPGQLCTPKPGQLTTHPKPGNNALLVKMAN